MKNLHSIIGPVCRSVAIALGIAVVVLAAFGKLGVCQGFELLGIGLTCTGIGLLDMIG